MSSSTERRPSRLAKLNAGDKIKDQMDHLLFLASGKAYLKEDNNDNNDNNDGDKGGSGKEDAVRPGRRKRRPADDLSDTERATTSTATNTDASKKAQTRSKKQKEDDGDNDGGGARHAESSIPAMEVKKKPGRPKKQKPTNDDTIDQTEASTPAEEVKKKPGRPKRQKTGDNDGEGSGRVDNDESSIPVEEPKRKPGRPKRQMATESGGDAGHGESSIPAEEGRKTPERPKKQKIGDDDTADHPKPSTSTIEPKKRVGRLKKQQADGDKEVEADHTESSVRLTEEPKKKRVGRLNKQKEDGSDKGEAGGAESSIPAEEARETPGGRRKQKTVDTGDGIDHDKPSVVTQEPKKKLGRPKKQKADDVKETEADHPETTIPTDRVRKKQGRPKKQESAFGDDGAANDEPSVPTEGPKKKPGWPKKQKADQEFTDHVVVSKRRQEPSLKQVEDMSDSDDVGPSITEWEVKTRGGRSKNRQQHLTIDDIQGNSSESDYKRDSTSESGSNSDEDTPSNVRNRSGKKGKGRSKDKTSAEDSSIQKEKKLSKRELTRMAKVARVQERARRKQEMLDAKAAKVKAKQEREAMKLKRARRSFLAIPLSVQLAHAVENMAFEATQQQSRRKEMEKMREEEDGEEVEGDDEVEDLALYSSNLIHQVLKPELKGFSYRWPIREDLLHSVPESSYRDTVKKLDDFEEYGLGFVEELTGVPKNEEDYSDTDTEEDDAGSNEDDHESSSQKIGEQEDGSDQSAEESAKEIKLRRNRKRYAERVRARNKTMEGLVEREDLAPRDRSERHEDERYANARLEAVQALFDGEVARFAQTQYRKGIPERIQDLDQVQKLTLSESCHQAVRTPIGSDLSGFDQEDDLTRLQQRAIAFSAEDAVRKTLDRMTYVVRQGSLLRMPGFPTQRRTIEGGLYKTKYERGWDTVMTSAALAGVDDRILKKVSMRMQNLLSKSKNPYHYEADSEGGWTTVDDTINKIKDPSRKPLRVKEPVGDPMDPMNPMNPDFNPQELSNLADPLRGKENHVPEADVKQGRSEDHEMETTSRLRSMSSVSSGSRAATRSTSGSEPGSESGSGSGSGSGSDSSSSPGGSASEDETGSESESESESKRSHKGSDDDNDDDDGSD